MPYLVDGHNVLGFLSGKSNPSEEEKQRLLRNLADRLRGVRARVEVVFDGPPRAGRSASSLGALSVRYAGTRPADDVIAEIVARSSSPADLRVVTDDRGLSLRAREAGARTLSAREFCDRFVKPGPEAEGGGRIDLEDWLDFFSDEQNRLS